LTLDVTDADGIAAAAKEIYKKFGRLDILINNAGINVDEASKKVSEQTLTTWRKTFDTNLFALIAVTQAFLPLLEKSDAGRIVNLSSNSRIDDAAFRSDIADLRIQGACVQRFQDRGDAWTVQLAYELRDTKIKVNAAHPGYVKTDMGGPPHPWKSSTAPRPAWHWH